MQIGEANNNSDAIPGKSASFRRFGAPERASVTRNAIPT